MKLVMDDGTEHDLTFLPLGPEDVLLLKPGTLVSDQDKCDLQRRVSELFPKNRLVILAPNAELAVAKAFLESPDKPLMAALAAALRAVEWNGGAIGRCPECFGYKPDHAADCRLLGALKEAGYESKMEARHA
jgi:hypothetical protein